MTDKMGDTRSKAARVADKYILPDGSTPKNFATMFLDNLRGWNLDVLAPKSAPKLFSSGSNSEVYAFFESEDGKVLLAHYETHLRQIEECVASMPQPWPPEVIRGINDKFFNDKGNYLVFHLISGEKNVPEALRNIAAREAQLAKIFMEATGRKVSRVYGKSGEWRDQ